MYTFFILPVPSAEVILEMTILPIKIKKLNRGKNGREGGGGWGGGGGGGGVVRAKRKNKE